MIAFPAAQFMNTKSANGFAKAGKEVTDTRGGITKAANEITKAAKEITHSAKVSAEIPKATRKNLQFPFHSAIPLLGGHDLGTQ